MGRGGCGDRRQELVCAGERAGARTGGGAWARKNARGRGYLPPRVGLCVRRDGGARVVMQPQGRTMLRQGRR